MAISYSLSNVNIYNIYTLCQAFMECDFQTGVKKMRFHICIRKNYFTVNGSCITLCISHNATCICPWISIHRFNIESWPTVFLTRVLEFDLDKLIFFLNHFFPPLMQFIFKELYFKIPFRHVSRHFYRLVNPSIITIYIYYILRSVDNV